VADAYAKIVGLAPALRAFDDMPEKEWGLLDRARRRTVSGGRRHDVLGLFAEMLASSCVPWDSHACMAVVTMCAEDASLVS
jgi:hypothetical protein